MKIALIAWGSVIWDPRTLPREGVWRDDGPQLPIEFSRISKDARLTLVIDPQNGKPVVTQHCLSPRTSLDDAMRDLADREGTVLKRIGWVNLSEGKDSRSQWRDQIDVHDIVVKWCGEKKYDGAVWTALPPTFEENMGLPFTVPNALAYLRSLPINVRKEALKYIRNAPACVVTDLRKRAEEEIVEQSPQHTPEGASARPPGYAEA